ncbi:DNRLRE domain-containing protein [Scatolibacter rhodanostii]|uniref:DNRLRE domain-containing protein n=1 Tax=Scatolibacter rhodanostii TaxID=2014781 RepID=UPI000C07FCF0|nr:DNRLRE domain-containing protein [Scatolibacter rhodanostii]
MAMIDIKCTESISQIPKSQYTVYQNDKLYLGCNSQICLFFELPLFIFLNQIKSARLILFKIPLQEPICLDTRNNRYTVYPFLDFFSVYGHCYETPQVVDNLSIEYKDQIEKSYTEVDITEIVKAWIDQSLENKGILLRADPLAAYLAYASNRYKIRGMHPILRITLDGVNFPMHVAPCAVDIGTP